MQKLYAGEAGGWYVRTGEVREPRKGEFYISGAKPVAFRAPNNLTMRFHIAAPLDGVRKRRKVDGIWYVLDSNQSEGK